MLPGRFSTGTAYFGSGRGRVYAYAAPNAGAATDASSGAVPSSRSTAEAGAASDASSQTDCVQLGTTETGAAAEGSNTTYTPAPVVTETGAAQDAPTGGIFSSQTAQEAGSAVDGQLASNNEPVATQEAGAAADGLAPTLTLVDLTPETGAAAEIFTSTLGALALQVETNPLLDAETANISLSAVMAEAVAVSDVSSQVASIPEDTGEAGAAQDLVDAMLGAVANDNEAGSAHEAFDTLLSALADTEEAGAAADGLVTMLSALADTEEAGAAVDIAQGPISASYTAADAGATQDTLGSIETAIGSTSEASSAQDTPTTTGALLADTRESGNAVDTNSFGYGLALYDGPPLWTASIGGSAIGRLPIGGRVFGASDSSYVNGISYSIIETLTSQDAPTTVVGAAAVASEAGSALDALLGLIFGLAAASEAGSAFDQAFQTYSVVRLAFEGPSGLGSAATGGAPIGAVPLGGGPVGAADTSRSSSIGPTPMNEAASAQDAVDSRVGVHYASQIIESPSIPPSAVGMSPIGGTAIGAPVSLGTVAVYIPGPGAMDASDRGISRTLSVIDQPTTVNLTAYANPTIGGFPVGTAPVGGKGPTISVYSLGAKDFSRWAYFYRGDTVDVGIAIDHAYAFLRALRSQAEASPISDKVAATIVALAYEALAASDFSDAHEFLLFAIRAAGYQSGAALTTVGSGAFALGTGSGTMIETVGSGLSVAARGSGFQVTGIGSGTYFVGSEIMAAVLDQNFYVGEHWPILGTATDFQGRVIDLTGAQIRFRLVDLNGVDVMDLSLNHGIAILDPPVNGQYLIMVSPANQISSKIIPGDYGVECRITTGAGIVTTQLVGIIHVLNSRFF